MKSSDTAGYIMYSTRKLDWYVMRKKLEGGTHGHEVRIPSNNRDTTNFKRTATTLVVVAS